MKLFEKYVEITELFDNFQQRFYQKEPPNVSCTYMKLLTFKMRSKSRIQDHIHAFNDSIIDLQSIEEEIFDAKNA